MPLEVESFLIFAGATLTGFGGGAFSAFVSFARSFASSAASFALVFDVDGDGFGLRGGADLGFGQ